MKKLLLTTAAATLIATPAFAVSLSDYKSCMDTNEQMEAEIEKLSAENEFQAAQIQSLVIAIEQLTETNQALIIAIEQLAPYPTE